MRDLNNPFDRRAKRRFNSNLTEDSFDLAIQDSVSEVTVEKRQKRKSFFGWLLFVSIIVGGIIWGVTLLLKPPPILVEEIEFIPESTETSQSEVEEITAEAIPEINNPMKEIAKDFPKVGVGEVNVELDENVIKVSGTSSGSLIFDEEVVLTPSEIPCTVKEVNELCLAAVGENKDEEQSFEVLYLKDAIGNRIFENAKNFHEVQVEGSLLAASFILSNTDSPMNFMVVTLNDGGGFLIRYNDNANDFEEILTSMKVVE